MEKAVEHLQGAYAWRASKILLYLLLWLFLMEGARGLAREAYFFIANSIPLYAIPSMCVAVAPFAHYFRKSKRAGELFQRLRRYEFWTTAIFTGVWIVSVLLFICVPVGSNRAMGIGGGNLLLFEGSVHYNKPIRFEMTLMDEVNFLGGFRYQYSGFGPNIADRFSVPIWPIVVLFLGSYILMGSPRRCTLGHCRNCEYDLCGNVSGVCPECGTPIPPDVKAEIHSTE